MEEETKMKSNNLVLDDTIRYLYITIRKHGAYLLGVKFIHNGKKWEADTPEEAIRLRKQLELEEDAEARAMNPDVDDWYTKQESAWTPDVFWNFMHDIQFRQKQVLLTIWEKSGITSTQLAEKLKLTDEVSLAGVLSGLSKRLKKLDLKTSDLYQVHTEWEGKNKTRAFYLQRAFRLAAEEVGWPEERKNNDAASTKGKRK
jgi:hypothetical protein